MPQQVRHDRLNHLAIARDDEIRSFMQYIHSISELVPHYDAFILDLWGVIHDGQKPYAGVLECLTKLKEAGRKTILLSNAPRRVSVVVEAMHAMGIARELYDQILTSGEAAYQVLKERMDGQALPINHQPSTINYLYLGLEKDRQIIKDLGYVETDDATKAHFALVSHFAVDHQPMREIEPFLNECLINKLPMHCINPDREVVRQSGERVACAGVIAAEYERRGGEVIYYGKPHLLVYEECLRRLRGIPRSKILAIGDSPRTDIAGANRMNIDSMLVTGGVLAAEVGTPDDPTYLQKTESILIECEVCAQYVCERFVWS